MEAAGRRQPSQLRGSRRRNGGGGRSPLVKPCALLSPSGGKERGGKGENLAARLLARSKRAWASNGAQNCAREAQAARSGEPHASASGKPSRQARSKSKRAGARAQLAPGPEAGKWRPEAAYGPGAEPAGPEAPKGASREEGACHATGGSRRATAGARAARQSETPRKTARRAQGSGAKGEHGARQRAHARTE